MAQRLKEVDVVVVGVGFAGSILAKEFASAGLKSRRAGAWRDAIHSPYFPSAGHAR